LCTAQHGSVNISASGSSLSTFFPLNYTLAYDVDNNNTWNFSDSYTYGSDNTTPDTTINGLVGGNYIVTVGSSKGCNLKSFPFSILACQTLLPIKLLDFSLAGSDARQQEFTWRFSDVDEYAAVILESSTDGRNFRHERSWQVTPGSPLSYRASLLRGTAQHFRLRLVTLAGRTEFSRVLFTGNESSALEVFPNPVTDRLRIRLRTSAEGTVRYQVTSVEGRVETSGVLTAHSGLNEWPVPVQGIQPGLHQLTLNDGNGTRSVRFVRQ
ncbi:MAG: T9SS type A sorting domain-containing protein, partial [Chitinophagaceae bacterium]